MDNRDRSSTPNNCSHDGSGAQIDHEHIKQPRGDSPSPMPMTLPRVVVVSGKQYTYHELVCPVPRRRTGGGGGGSATVCSGDGSDRAHMNAHGKENALGNHNSNSRDDSAHHHHVLVQMQEAFSADEHLLLQILTHLNPVELSVARQVSRLWRSVADSNTVWRPICTRKWPSWKTQTMKATIMAMGGYAKQYRRMAPRRRSNIADLLLTLDVVATSYERGVPVDRTIAGIALDGVGSTFVPAFYTKEWARNNRSSDQLVHKRRDGDPWKVTVKPYAFQTLEDVIAGTVPTKEQAAHCRMMPELRIKLGVVNKRTQQLAHVATLHEGLGLRTKKYYLTEAPEDSNGEYDAALGLPDIDNDAVNRGEQRSNQGGGGGGENEGMSRPAQPCWLGFSGEVALPESLGSGHPTHVVDIILVGSKKSVADQGSGDGDRGVPEEVTYSFSDIRVGPLFNLARSMIDGHPAGGANDLVDMLDLKLGGFTQYNNGHFGVQAV